MMKIFSAIFLLAALVVCSTEAFSPTKIRKQISGLTKDNFDATLKELEPFLTKEAGATMYSKSMRRIAVKAKAFGTTLPTDFAKEAKATEKRREKQKAFIQAKEEEAAAAAAAAEQEAEAPAEEAASAE
ncbi:hypothetical protein IV203_001245 [Nitzschia inconspicua]|uniref:Uncharacterized protein n=1 Tax=Nitzschia inconspicua TaxID=303405 RepID=A0A9K3L7C9_9STRA|nr:hypothetical protein IV203_001245 [Nitzschia inconspicua]